MNYQKLNAATISDPFPLSFTDSILDMAIGCEVYSFLDRVVSCNQVHMALKKQEKTAFLAEAIMMFRLKKAM